MKRIRKKHENNLEDTELVEFLIIIFYLNSNSIAFRKSSASCQYTILGFNSFFDEAKNSSNLNPFLTKNISFLNDLKTISKYIV